VFDLVFSSSFVLIFKNRKMKKIFLLALVPALMFSFAGCKKETEEKPNDQTQEEFLAPTNPMKRNVLLEALTGVRCGFCPDGHARAKALADANPGKVVVVGVHAGLYATPQNGWANFTNPFSIEIDKLARPMGYPAGMVNRIKFDDLLMSNPNTGAKSNFAMNRGAYTTAASRVFEMDAPVNIGAKATLDKSSRELTVKVDLYYTAEENVDNFINVALLQDGVVANQSGGSPTYIHTNILRHLITGTWGDAVSTDKKVGTKYTKTFKYTIPEDYNGATVPPGGGSVDLNKLSLAIFVTQDKSNVLNAIKADIK